MVVTAAVLVVGDDQQRFGPEFRLPERGVHVQQERFSQRDVIIWVLAIARAAPLRLQEYVTCQRSLLDGVLKVGVFPELALGRLRDIGDGPAR